ncbi:MAG TPA: hypothetical protein VNO50_17325 [Pyrinomonadaceae bacterium]|nr:hypothetical protein [Pyrinomonadaceae bacterium]
MRFHLSTLLFLLIGATFASVQEVMPQRSKRVVVVPREVGLITVAYQPNCPLQFENAKLFAGVDGGGLESYDIRNIGTKPVRAITIGTSSGNRWTWGVSAEEGPVMPGQLIPPGARKNGWKSFL